MISPNSGRELTYGPGLAVGKPTESTGWLLALVRVAVDEYELDVPNDVFDDLVGERWPGCFFCSLVLQLTYATPRNLALLQNSRYMLLIGQAESADWMILFCCLAACLFCLTFP